MPPPRPPPRHNSSEPPPSSSAPRPTTRRLPSTGVSSWTRLRAPQIDPLSAYGLVSKGETRLHDPKTQETFFALIVSRYMALLRAQGPDLWAGADDDAELALVLAAMRKLREALHATGRRDAFAARAYLLVLRVGVLARRWEAYVPALEALLIRTEGLAQGEVRDVVGYAVLDAVCRRGEVGEGLRVRMEWRRKGVRLAGEVEGVVMGVVRDDWLLYRRMERKVDGYARAIMGFGAQRMREHVLKVIGRAYHRIEVGVLEEWTGMGWEGLVKEGRVGWERDGTWVVVRKAKGQ